MILVEIKLRGGRSMEQKDDWTDTLRHKEKADEDRYFAAQDRVLIETRQRQRQPAQAAKPHATVADVPAAPAPLDSAEP